MKMRYEQFPASLRRFRHTGLRCTFCDVELRALIGNFLGDTTLVVCPKCRHFAQVPTVLRGGQLWFDNEAVQKAVSAANTLPGMSVLMGVPLRDLEKNLLENLPLA